MNNDYDILYSPQAVEDLKDIYRYIRYELLAPENAQGQVERIQKKIQSLGILPSRYAKCDWEPWNSMNMHKLPK